jgi:hypothetical protein
VACLQRFWKAWGPGQCRREVRDPNRPAVGRYHARWVCEKIVSIDDRGKETAGAAHVLEWPKLVLVAALVECHLWIQGGEALADLQDVVKELSRRVHPGSLDVEVPDVEDVRYRLMQHEHVASLDHHAGERSRQRSWQAHRAMTVAGIAAWVIVTTPWVRGAIASNLMSAEVIALSFRCAPHVGPACLREAARGQAIGAVFDDGEPMGSARGGTGVECTMEVMVWPNWSTWSRVSVRLSTVAACTLIKKQSSPLIR